MTCLKCASCAALDVKREIIMSLKAEVVVARYRKQLRSPPVSPVWRLNFEGHTVTVSLITAKRALTIVRSLGSTGDNALPCCLVEWRMDSGLWVHRVCFFMSKTTLLLAAAFSWPHQVTMQKAFPVRYAFHKEVWVSLSLFTEWLFHWVAKRLSSKLSCGMRIGLGGLLCWCALADGLLLMNSRSLHELSIFSQQNLKHTH